MISAPEVGRVVEAGSRDHLVQAFLLDPAGSYVEALPLSRIGGELRAAARPGDLWGGRIELAGSSRVPTGPTDPLAGFTGHRVRVLLGTTVDTVPTYLTAADLLVVGTRVDRSARDYRVSVELGGLASYVDAAAERDYAPRSGESCGAMIERVVNDNRPAGWPRVTVLDTSTRSDRPVPSDYRSRGRTGWAIVRDLSTIANVTAYVDRYQRLVIRDPLPETPTIARTLSAETDLIEYGLDVGRRSFANRVELRCSPVQVSSNLGELRDDVVGVAEHRAGPLGVDTIGRVVRDEQQLTGTISKAHADERAAALLGPFLRGWYTAELTITPDPRLDPDDDLAVTYTEGPTVTHRVTELSLPLDTGPMRLACRTLTDVLPTQLGG